MYAFVACLSQLSIDHASLSRQNRVREGESDRCSAPHGVEMEPGRVLGVGGPRIDEHHIIQQKVGEKAAGGAGRS